MFEKVNPSHPDKVADRIAGAIVDLGYQLNSNPKIAVEVLIGHGECTIIIETNVQYNQTDIFAIVYRICQTENIKINLNIVNQDIHLAENQIGEIKCGDNGIFKGTTITREQQFLTNLVSRIYDKCPFDGKYIINDNKIICCQSHIKSNELKDNLYEHYNGYKIIVNPLGDWDGGTNVDCGATNRKLGSDMGDSVTGGGLHGKDLSKADVAINIYCFLKAQGVFRGEGYTLSCAIGDDTVDGKPYSEIVKIARNYINKIGGFEKFAEWGLIRNEDI